MMHIIKVRNKKQGYYDVGYYNICFIIVYYDLGYYNIDFIIVYYDVGY